MSFVGRKLVYKYDSGVEVAGHFKSATELTWEALTGPAKGRTGTETIHTAEVAPNVFFVSWLESEGTSVSQVLDLNRWRVAAFVTFETGQGRRSSFDQGTIAEQ